MLPLRCLVVLALFATPALAGPAGRDAKIHQCHVVNDTDHQIGRTGIHPGESWWILEGTFTTLDGDVKLAIPCPAGAHVLRLTGPAGKVTVERMPDWFGFRADAQTEVLTITARGRHAAVEVDGKPVALRKGVATVPFDARARLLARDPRDVFTAWHAWRVPVRITARSGRHAVELAIQLDVSKAARALADELRGVERAPLAWAAAPDRSGPVVVVERERSYRKRAARCGLGDLVPVRRMSSLAETSLVAICEAGYQRVDTCPPSKDPFAAGEPPVRRYRTTAAIRVIEAKTGKLVAMTTLSGRPPPPCRDTSVGQLTGPAVARADILAWLSAVR